MHLPLGGKLVLFAIGIAVAAIGIAFSLESWFESPLTAALVAVVIIGPVAFIWARVVLSQVRRTLQAVSDGITSMKDRDFSVSIASPDEPGLRSLVASYNALGTLLRDERQSLYQRELLLDTVIQATPISMVLTNATGRVVYSNIAARQTFLGGRNLEGLSFDELLKAAPEPLQQAVTSGADTLFTLDAGGESEIYHLSQRAFLLNSQAHRLLLLKQMTRELSRQEVETWKKVIRVIAHELNNSLAPISSLAHSGRQFVHRAEGAQFERIFQTIEERARHLHTFIDGYARFAKLPRPHAEAVDWNAFLRALQNTLPFVIMGEVPSQPATFDPAQMEQVLINLVKNAVEAGASPNTIEVRVSEQAGGWAIQVHDRGSGMPEEVLRNALLPFYSTKPAGAGLGLTVCREVIEAHGGRISLANRSGGGLTVSLWIPRREPESTTPAPQENVGV
jgi:two-component system, NtrC family, nitrogen regulation sensor histidine kinase NtrY